ncbi:uncharacterized protein PV09_09371 [Verruconis gallopava]|uniref:FAD dependent oxidoreductase domain-containing protein n=1 Tax=Verruconis gallopava TaxID=253628 RepID=A0A0D1YDR8_9PEZI|nr:uncharacterized protein PV09_09371 [Verruconis gallopava]KIV98881.1 hypothetical protein PV09_09371 [Verruconis gallopava]
MGGSNTNEFDFIIVGGGCIAASTVYAIKKKWPAAQVSWYTGVHEHTASNDFLKIIRDAYPDKIMAEWAHRAMQLWASDDLLSKYFHRTAWIQAIDKKTTKTMSKGQKDKTVMAKEMMEQVGSTIEPSLASTEELYFNPNVGYADSDVAVRAISDKAVELGVQRHKSNVTRLVIEAGKCVGVEVGDAVLRGKTTIISAGAWTPGILEKSNIAVPPEFFQVTAVGVAVLKLSDSEFDSLKSMPILVTKDGEVMLSELHRVLKITTTDTFRIASPDDLSDEVDITPNQQVLEKMLPQFRGRELKRFCCPDLITPKQYPIIDRVDGISNLILATGGSYHSYKFLVNIGNLVVLCICGEESNDPLERTIQARCRWQRSDDITSVHPNIVPI